MAKEIDFRRDIRPILSDKCLYRHGPSEESLEAGLPEYADHWAFIAPQNRVIHALNQGKPYDEFVMAQIAGFPSGV